MSTLLTLIAASLLWLNPASQTGGDGQPAGRPEQERRVADSEKAFEAVLANREKFLPVDFGLLARRRDFGELQISVKMLGEAQTADGPRKLAVVQVRARAEDGEWPQEVLGLWVTYFTPEMKYVEHHNQGCGSELRLEGSVIRYGEDRSFDLATREGLDGFKATQNWC